MHAAVVVRARIRRDVENAHWLADRVDGVNLKLMKCGGLTEALRIVATARAHGLQTMIGCMTETSCAVSAAAHLAPLVEGADLDGPLLIKDDPFEGAELVDGVMTPLDAPGIGVRLRP